MKYTVVILAAALFVSGCSAVGLGSLLTAPLASQAPVAMADVKKALIAAHEVHASTARFLTIAANTNLCHATCASTSKTLLDESEAYLVAADNLVALGDAPGIQAKISSATALIANINSLIGKK